MNSDDANPFVAPDLLGTDTKRSSSPHLLVCVAGWCVGTFLLSAMFAIDTLLSDSLPGGVLYVVLIASPILTFIFSIAAPISLGARGLAFIGSVAVMLVQFIAFAILALATSGMEGIQ